jgi:uncharacterized protein (TIGR02453 family)
MTSSARTAGAIPAEAFDFYDALAADPSKAFWEAHKQEYLDVVRTPLAQLCTALEDEFGPAHLFRPYRDVRFSKDKSPYKDHQGAFVEVQDRVGYYVQISGGGLMVAGGWYAPGGQQVHRFRAAVAGPKGAALVKALAAAAKAGFDDEGDMMKTRPRGVEPDAPRLELLRHRSLVAVRRWEPAAWMGTAKGRTTVRDSWRALRPLVDWLGDHVGPAEEAPR